MQFTLTIELGNQAMQTGSDVIKSIRESLKGEEELEFDREVSGRLWDENGNIVGHWEAVDGKKLADFANSGKLFKRPMHANPHGFTAGSDSLKEIRTSTWGGQINICSDFPRLTREDLTATDWEEVTLPKEVEEYRNFGANNTTNTGADGLLPALS